MSGVSSTFVRFRVRVVPHAPGPAIAFSCDKFCPVIDLSCSRLLTLSMYRINLTIIQAGEILQLKRSAKSIDGEEVD